MRQQGKSDAYYELLRKSYELDTANSVAGFYLGYCQLFLDNEAAVKEGFNLMKKHVEANPLDIREARLYAVMASRIQRFDETISTFESIVRNFPKNIEDKYSLARAYSMHSKFDKAIAVYDSIETTTGITSPVSLQKIELYLSKNDTANAINEAQALLNSAPKNLRYNGVVGDVYMHLSMPDSAFRYYEVMEKIDSSSPEVALSKAAYYQIKKDSVNQDKQIYRALINENLEVGQKVSILTQYIQQTLRSKQPSPRIENLFNVILKQHPHDAEIRRLYGKYAYTLDDYESAAEQFSYALDIDPTNAEDWKILTLSNVLTYKYDEALNSAKKAIEYNPEDINLKLYIVSLYNQIGECDKAINLGHDLLAKSDSLDYGFKSEICTTIADTYFVKGQTDSCFQYYEKALDYNKKNYLAMNNYAYFLSVSDKDLDKAESMSAEVIKAYPENSTYLDTYAWIFFKKKEYELALMYIQRAVSCINEKDNNADLYEHYGDILFMNRKPKEAVEQWQKALELTPDNELLQKKVKHKTYFYE